MKQGLAKLDDAAEGRTAATAAKRTAKETK
jgi:hypothetical protein